MKTAGISTWQVTTVFLYAAALATASLSAPPSGSCPRPGTGVQACVSIALGTPLILARADSGP